MNGYSIAENVRNAGGKTNGALRFSIQWNDGNDLDIHCQEPTGGMHICYVNPINQETRGHIDVEIESPFNGRPSIESMVWPNKKFMIPGKYDFYVQQYIDRGGKDGFKAEIEFSGQVFQFAYSKALKQDEIVKVAEVTLDQNGIFTIHEYINN